MSRTASTEMGARQPGQGDVMGLGRPRTVVLRGAARLAFGLGAVLMLAAAPAGAAEFRPVGVAAAILYDGPSVKGSKRFVAPRGMPLEVLSEVNQWVKVREQGGDVLWIEKKDLGTGAAWVAAQNAGLRAQPQETAPVVVPLERGVPLAAVEGTAPAGWTRVRLPDGIQGFVRNGEIWGR